jgi:succinate dehydrogenase hydrophobic anchor subunit
MKTMSTYNWWLVRVPALLLFPSFVYDLEIMFLIFPFLFVHLTIGLKTTFQDYLHNQTSKILLLVLIRLTSLEFLRYSLELLI